jgi:catechol 2,3-dioxygenase-like lactoylglutathione lyase family enzyme
MSDLAILRPARRFLHLCYCCNDGGAAVDLFVDNLAMRNIMNTPMEATHAGLLGIDAIITSQARFVYDRRGARTSPAIEIQHWVDPAPEGIPSLDPFEVGIKALGFAVPDVIAATDRMVAAGCSVIARSASPFEADLAVLKDPSGTTLELTAGASLKPEETQMNHLRVTVSDLEQSLPFYDMLGFDIVERGEITSADFVGHDGEADASFVVMRLPDEPFTVRLIQWRTPAGHGRHYTNPWHAGLFRAALGVDDTRASYDAMTAAGAVFDRPPQDVILNPGAQHVNHLHQRSRRHPV